MNWLYLPNARRWINLDFMVSIEVVPEDETEPESRRGKFMTLSKDGDTHYTLPGDAAVIFERLKAIDEASRVKLEKAQRWIHEQIFLHPKEEDRTEHRFHGG